MNPRTRAVGTLVVAQALGLAGPPLVVMVGPLVGRELAPSDGLATLPLAAMIVGIALGSGPAAYVMERVGRRRGFALGALVSAFACALAALAVTRDAFAFLCVSTLLLGTSIAFVQQYRFAAAETAGVEAVGRAVAWVLAGGVVAGILGPEIGSLGRDVLTVPYAGSFAILVLLYAALALFLLVGLPHDEPRRETERAGTDRGSAADAPLAWKELVLPVAAGVAAYGVMTFVMTATPLAMRDHGQSVDATALVIQAHVVAMYAPSLVSGYLAARFGLQRLMVVGVTSLSAGLVVGAVGTGLPGWVGALVFLGLGWNLLFLGGTVALAQAFPGETRFRAQALNDSLVFSARAAASLGAGFVLAAGGWTTVLLVSVAPVAAMAAMLGALGSRRARGAEVG